MEQKKSTSKYWLWFALSVVFIIVLLIWVRQYFWIALPFVVTTFAKALDLIDDNQPEDQEVY